MKALSFRTCLVLLIFCIAVALVIELARVNTSRTGEDVSGLLPVNASSTEVVPPAVQQSAVDTQPENKLQESKTATSSASVPGEPTRVLFFMLKDVGEAALDHFGLSDKDFATIRAAGFNVIEGNFDTCASDEDVQYFLDSAQQVGLKVVLNAGAGESEWGYACDEEYAPNQKPAWQKEEVRRWVEKWKNHPALLMWDTSNEDGGTLPYGTGGTMPDPAWETKFALTTEQLQQAYRDVKSFDPAHQIMIRMNGWYFYDNTDNFFRPGNYFGTGVADVVMINAYSNVDEYFDDFVSTVLRRATRSIYAIDPHATIISSLGVWTEPPIWYKPTPEHLINDYRQSLQAEYLVGIAFFKYGASRGEDWFLPDAVRGDPALWQTISELMRAR